MINTKSNTITATVTRDIEAGMGYVQYLYGRKITKTINNGKTIDDYDIEGNLIGYEFFIK